MDLCHVDVTVTDDHGVVVYSADHEVTWTIEGPARLLGIESGDPASHESYKANKRRVFHGREWGIYSPHRRAAAVKIRLSSPGLMDAAMTTSDGVRNGFASVEFVVCRSPNTRSLQAAVAPETLAGYYSHASANQSTVTLHLRRPIIRSVTAVPDIQSIWNLILV